MRWWMLGLLLTSAGCAYKVKVSSQLAGVSVELPDGERVIAPTEFDARWVPFGSQVIRASAPGHRTLEVDLRDREVRFGHYITDTLFRPATLFGAPRGEVRLVLIPEHGPAGTWSEDAVP